MLELQITSPSPGQKFPQIKWNHEDLKTEVTELVKDYQNVVVTTETEKDAKEAKAKLNKLLTALETARKDMKKKANEPVRIFEAQVKEVEEPINMAIQNLDKQLKELDTAKKEQKRKDIEVIWNGIAKKPTYITLEKVWNEKWLNATYSMKQITEDMNNILTKNKQNVETINNLPECSFEAMRYYTQTLDLSASIARATEHLEIERSKKAAEAAKQNQVTEQPEVPKILPVVPQNEVVKPIEDEKMFTYTFSVTLTAGQAKVLGEFCRAHGIKLTQIK